MELLQRLINAFGPSGNEVAVRNIIMKDIKPYVDKMWVDGFGNLIAHKKGKGQKVMLAAHMDEIALMIKKIEENGFLRLSPVGGIESLTLLGQNVFIFSPAGKFICNGIVSFPELHEGLEIEKDKQIKMDDLYIDTGLGKKESKKLGIEIGCYVIPSHSFKYLGNKKIFTGKALDDRVGCYILAEIAKKIKSPKVDLYLVFTVQEEMGLYGAKTSVYQINPIWGVAIDVTDSHDSDIKGENIIGAGPSITVKDAEMLSNPDIDNKLKSIAKKKKIPYQLEVSEFGTTDATSMMLSRKGIASTAISIPIRNIHSTVGIAHIDDIDNAIKLIVELLKDPPKIGV
ncbi:M28 family peptidase [Candidatus Woesearchaeota archaeon]|nr:M28 family peptidase [Candidatus Woesearchaeota archaeon]